jgi:hemerythrin-like domain-containing protein
MRDTARADPDLLLAATDFFRTYTDRTHHGKEESILFDELASKPLSEDDRQMMERLIEEHVWTREAVGRLAAANELYLRGRNDGLIEIMHEVEKLAVFYPLHIKKEDKHFFVPAMGYFTAQEQQDMLDRFSEFDARMIQEKYERVVDESERRVESKASPLWLP